MRHHWKPRAALLALTITLLVLSGVAAAQQGTDPLQGRLLERSDGTTFVYKDGLRYSVQPADLSDADIDVIPVAGSADRLDQLFAQSPSADANVAMPTPTASPALPEPGTLLYQVDWSGGANGWALPADWRAANGLLSNTGALTDLSVIASAYEPPSPDYAVEADIQAVKYAQLPCCARAYGFGLVARGDAHYEHHAGVLDDGHTVGTVVPGTATSARRAFNAGMAWHTYRLETKGDKFRLLIDGVVWTEGSPSPGIPYPYGRIMGLWSQATQINVRSFRVFAL